MTEDEFKRDDAAYEASLEQRDARERHDDIVGDALDGWLRSQRIARTPRLAEIGNGLFVRVGTGRKRRKA